MRKLSYMENTAFQGNNGRVRVLVVSNSDIEAAGGGDSNREIAEALARDYDVILALPSATNYTHSGFAVIYYNQRNLVLVARDSELVICDKDVFAANRFFTDSGSIAAANLPRLRQGVIDAEAIDAEQDSSYFVWVPPEQPGPRPPGGALHKWRYYLQKGGLRLAIRRALTGIRRRLGPRG